MMPSPGPPLALTMGEPGGVGPEIALKAHQALRKTGPVFYLIADPQVFIADNARINVCATPHEAARHFGATLPIVDVGVRARATPGCASIASASSVIASIERAVEHVLLGEAAGVVTNPIQKSTLIKSGFKFPGHTEFLEALAFSAPMPAGRSRGVVMMIAGPDLRTVPLTIHVPIRKAADLISTDMIIAKAIIVMEALRLDFGIAAPRIAISGLNPHAGENGEFGTEERDIIAPAIARLRDMFGDAIRGPLPADTMFHEEARAHYDAALCMLHDQALIPAKTLSFHEAVNVTLGLPIIRTSPDHGAALDIAGKGVARAGSLIAAIRLAADLAAKRRMAPR